MGTWNRMVTRRDPGMETCLCTSLLVFPACLRLPESGASTEPVRTAGAPPPPAA
jgi:hypothetical protein